MSTEPTNPDEGHRVRPLADILLDLNRGRTHSEASVRMQELVAAVMETGRKGSLSIVITVAKSKASGQVEILDEVRCKTPQPDRAASIFFVDDDANLTRHDPHQLELELRDVSADRADTPLREAH